MSDTLEKDSEKVKGWVSDIETCDIEILTPKFARIATIPICGLYNIDDVARYLKRENRIDLGSVVYRRFPCKQKLTILSNQKMDAFSNLLECYGCKTNVINSKLYVAHKDTFDLLAFAKENKYEVILD